ncbi:MAG: proteasome assembly chaperone family protein [Candidatus Jordarchaeales archaeon]|nr:proteasome assembly chaperone family protein [Candidatus Jordarchaeia archaeon]
MEKKFVSIVETGDINVKNPKIVIGLPDVGLVGVILANHMIQTMDMKEVGHIESDLFPPIIILHKGKPHHPFRLYRKDDLLLLVSEIAIPPIAIYDTAREICDWARSKNVSLILPIGGTPVPNRMMIDKPKVFAIPVGGTVGKLVESLSIELFEEGMIVGPYARIIAECERSGLPCLTLLSQSYPNYPDPGAAAATAEVLSKVVNVGIDVAPLEEQAEEIRLRMKDLMKRTMLEMERMGKSQEYELPAMYS